MFSADDEDQFEEAAFREEETAKQEVFIDKLYEVLSEAWDLGFDEAKLLEVWQGVVRDKEDGAEEFEERRRE